MIRDWIVTGENLTIGAALLRIAVALVLSALIGVDRETRNRPAGIRTHMLVCLGAMLIAMIEQQAVVDVVALASSHVNVSIGRLSGAVVSGIGFLGAGNIIASKKKVRGLTTAASIWCTACIGIAVGFGFIPLAIMGGVLVLLVLRGVQKIAITHYSKQIDVEFINREETSKYIEEYFESLKIKVIEADYRSTRNDDGVQYAHRYKLSFPKNLDAAEVAARLTEHSNIRSVRTDEI